MKFISLILKNPFRNKTRATLSIIGIAIGIATIVALGLITGGLEESVQTTLNSGGAEITVSGAIDNESGQTININSSFIDKIENFSGVNETAGILSISEYDESDESSMPQGGGPSMGGLTVYGIDSDKLDLVGIKDVNGSIYEDDSYDAIIGKTLANSQNKTIGDTIEVSGHDFEITGIFETGSMMSDNGVYLSHSKLKNLTNNSYYSQILVKTNEGVNDSELSDSIEDKYGDNLTTTTAEEQAQMMSSITTILDTVTYAISGLAILVGGIGIINTMIMAVYERTKEIGVLRAVGWKSRKILTMIMGETLVLTILSAIVGIIGGIAISEIGMKLLGNANDMFSLAYTPKTFIIAFAVAILVGLVGGIYPAYKASHLAPTEALRYE